MIDMRKLLFLLPVVLAPAPAFAQNWITTYSNNSSVSGSDAMYEDHNGTAFNVTLNQILSLHSATGDCAGTTNAVAVMNLACTKIGGKNVSLAGPFTMSGAFTFTGNISGNTAVTFPTTGTLMAGVNNLSEVASAATARTNLGLANSAIIATGTSGATIPLLNGSNTWSALNNYTGGLQVSGAPVLTTSSVPSASTLGGIKSSTAASGQFANAVDTGGNVVYAAVPYASVSGTPSTAPVVATASLPAVTTSNTGAVAYATDCRNSGEAAGAGTGCTVAVNKNGIWAAVWSGLAVTH